jgi:hypothetical protein
MKNLRLILILTIIVFMPTVIYAAPAESIMSDNLQDMKREALSKIDILACLDNGGIIKSVCMLGMPACVHTHNDAGKECSSSAECQGDCRVEGVFLDSGTKAIGSCSVDSDPCGCFQLIESGVAEFALCVD